MCVLKNYWIKNESVFFVFDESPSILFSSSNIKVHFIISLKKMDKKRKDMEETKGFFFNFFSFCSKKGGQSFIARNIGICIYIKNSVYFENSNLIS
jgi:hypothetical protein